MRLSQLQAEHREWQGRNFPNQTLEQALMGMMEELGELCHAVLKHSQGIRGIGEDELVEKVMDAHADLNIFSCFVANHFGYDIEEVTIQTWQERVQKRDWVNNPTGEGY